MKLIFVHGRAQEGKDPDALKNIWVESLNRGLKKNNLSLSNSVEVYFPYYGDLLKSLVEKSKNNIASVVSKGATVNADAEFFGEFLNELAEASNLSGAEIEKYYTGTHAERGPLNWEWVHAILKALDHTRLGGLSIESFTYDVFLYLTNRNIRKVIHEEILKSIPSEPIVWVGHSLGTVISYNLLLEQSSPNVKRFITLGSPLGLKAVKKHLTKPLKMPTIIKNGTWFNAYDQRDVVALKSLDSNNFPIKPHILDFDKVDNHTKNRHGIEGYLDDPIVAKQIYDALS